MTTVRAPARTWPRPIASPESTTAKRTPSIGVAGTPLRWSLLVLLCAWVLPTTAGTARAQRKGEIEIRVTDAETKKPVAVNIFLRDSRGRPVKAPRLPFWKDHFAFQHSVVLELRPGTYTFEMERGPEYKVRAGNFIINPGATDNTEVTMERFVDMKKEGWWSGDLHIHRPPADIPLLMLASDLHVAPVITWWNEQNAWKNRRCPKSPWCAATTIATTICSPERTNAEAVHSSISTCRDRWSCRQGVTANILRWASFWSWRNARAALTSTSRSRSGGTCRSGLPWAWPIRSAWRTIIFCVPACWPTKLGESRATRCSIRRRAATATGPRTSTITC